jgi:hypothetical protein
MFIAWLAPWLRGSPVIAGKMSSGSGRVNEEDYILRAFDD